MRMDLSNFSLYEQLCTRLVKIRFDEVSIFFFLATLLHSPGDHAATSLPCGEILLKFNTQAKTNVTLFYHEYSKASSQSWCAGCDSSTSEVQTKT